MIDVATLTGAVVVALGDKVAGLMGNNDAWVDQVLGAADARRRAQLASALADGVPQEPRIRSCRHSQHLVGWRRRNVTAGLFLEEFVGDRPWAHLDIAGTARSSGDDGEVSKGGTGFGVRTLIELARTFRVPK